MLYYIVLQGITIGENWGKDTGDRCVLLRTVRVHLQLKMQSLLYKTHMWVLFKALELLVKAWFEGFRVGSRCVWEVWKVSQS